jgi:hypothetical protein
VYVEHLRVFRNDFQPYFFAPAGYIEARIISLKPAAFWPKTQCAQFVVLETDHVDLRFRATSDPAPIDRPIAYDVDILGHVEEEVARLKHSASIQQPDGSMRACRFADCDLDRAEEFLRARYSRPFTLMNAMRWYKVPLMNKHASISSR